VNYHEGAITQADIKDPSTIEVVLGRTQVNDTGGERIAVDKIWVSQRALFAHGAPQGDYAVLKLAQPSAQPYVKLPEFSDSGKWAPGTNIVAAGWGCVGESSAPSCTHPVGEGLKTGTLTVQEGSVCGTDLADVATFEPVTQICAKDLQQGTSTCKGDSGGPLIVQGDDQLWYLVGLVSWGVTDCVPAAEVESKVGLLMPVTGGNWFDPQEKWFVKERSTQTQG
jgi:secreted trypsin-like serine protease